MEIGFIGAGRVGFSLGKYFSINNLKIKGYFSKTLSSAKSASMFTDSECFSSLNDIVKECDTLFLTVNDDELVNIKEELLKLNIKNKIIIHTSGSLSSAFLGDLNVSNYCYSLHPIYAFYSKYDSYKKLSNASFTIEGNNLYLDKIKNMILSLGNKCEVINTDKKTIYHASCVMMSNLVNSLIDCSFELLNEIGIKDTSLFTPLILNNIDNIVKLNPIEALSGPVKRKDINTLRKHLECLSDEKYEIYKLLSLHLIDELNYNDDFKEILKGEKI